MVCHLAYGKGSNTWEEMVAYAGGGRKFEKAPATLDGLGERKL